jgi:hypothetical protein
MSTILETIYTLEQFNKWRRGNKTITAPDPFEVGVAICDAVRLLRELFAMTARAEKAKTELVAAKEDAENEAKWALEYLRRAEKAEARLEFLIVHGGDYVGYAETWNVSIEDLDADMNEASK